MFYELRLDLETKGNKAELENPVYDLVDNVEDLSRFEITDYEPIFNTVRLKWGSSEVDAVTEGGSTGGEGFVVSKKLKDILQEHKLPEHKFFELEYLKRGSDEVEKDRYFWFQYVLRENYNWFDYANTKFYKREEIGDERDDVVIRSPEHLTEMVESSFEEDKRILFDSMRFNEQYDGQDFFELFRIIRCPIVSDKLKKRLEAEGITGFEPFKKLEIVY